MNSQHLDHTVEGHPAVSALAVFNDEMLSRLVSDLLEYGVPWWLENPIGYIHYRAVLQDPRIERVLLDYCAYGFYVQKPTNVFICFFHFVSRPQCSRSCINFEEGMDAHGVQIIGSDLSINEKSAVPVPLGSHL